MKNKSQHFLILWLTVLFCVLSSNASAEIEFKALEPLHISPEKAANTLSPFLEEGGIINISEQYVIIKTTRKNLGELTALLTAIDRPKKNLRVSVKYSYQQSNHERYYATNDRQGASHSAQVLEGKELFIETQEDKLIVHYDTYLGYDEYSVSSNPIWLEKKSGFVVSALVRDKQALVTLSTNQGQFSTNHAGQQHTALQTSIAAPLSEWFEVGGQLSQHRPDSDNYQTRGRITESRSIYLKIEVLQ